MERTLIHNNLDYVRRFSKSMLFFVVFALMLAVGCTPAKDKVSDVQRAESLLNSDPVQALEIMRSIDRSTIHENAEIAHYALVYSEACYYNRMLVTSDSLTRICVDYYGGRQDLDRRARASFQHGMVLNLAKQYPDAVIALMEALRSIDQSPNVRLEGVVHRTLGDIYRACYCYQNSYDEYVYAHECFSLLNLPYHTYYTKYNIGQASVKMRNYEEAEALFIEARDYSIENNDKDLLCAVLHELCEVHIMQLEYEECAETLDLFLEYDCLRWFVSRYYALRAIVASELGDNAAALEYVAQAEAEEIVDEALIEDARYHIYCNMGDESNALYWLERVNDRLSEALASASEQPVLNYRIDLLRSTLDQRVQESRLSRQRNVAVYVIVATIITIIIGMFRGFASNKNRDIRRYIETIHELQLTTNKRSDALSEAVDQLYNDRLSDLNRLCETYYEHSDTSRHASKVFEQVTETIESIKSDEARIEELERLVNQCRGNLMVKLREQCPRLNSREQRLVLYSYAGFSSRAISVFMETNPVALSKMKYRIKLKIKECEAEDAELLISSIGDR